MSRRGLLGLVGAGAAGVAIGAGAGVAGGIAIARAADGGAATSSVRLLRCAPGGHHDAGAGSHALRRVRHDGAHGSRRSDLPPPGLVVCRGAHDPGSRGQRDRRRRRLSRSAARTTPAKRSGWARAVSRSHSASARPCSSSTASTATASPSDVRPFSSGCPHSSATTSIPTSPAATCASKPVPTTRRSRCTRSAT